MCLGVLSAYMFGHYMYAMSEMARRGVNLLQLGLHTAVSHHEVLGVQSKVSRSNEDS